MGTLTIDRQADRYEIAGTHRDRQARQIAPRSLQQPNAISIDRIVISITTQATARYR
jgi:hypothetical protein